MCLSVFINQKMYLLVGWWWTSTQVNSVKNCFELTSFLSYWPCIHTSSSMPLCLLLWLFVTVSTLPTFQIFLWRFYLSYKTDWNPICLVKMVFTFLVNGKFFLLCIPYKLNLHVTQFCTIFICYFFFFSLQVDSLEKNISATARHHSEVP